VDVSVYTPEGRLVTRLVDGAAGPGTHSVTWDGRDSLGNQVASGVYYYQLKADRVSRTGRMVVLR